MDAIVNLRDEPKLREAFEDTQAHDSAVSAQRRTKCGNLFCAVRHGTRDEALARAARTGVALAARDSA